jgi:hypothetical protein
MATSTGTIGIRQPSNIIEEYMPPNVVNQGVIGGAQVSYGAAQTIAVGASLAPGTYVVSTTSAGTLDATGGTVTVYPVTITGGPTPPT